MAFLALASGQQYVYYTNADGTAVAVPAGAQQQLLVQPQLSFQPQLLVPETPEVTAAIKKTTCGLKSLLESSCDLSRSLNCKFASFKQIITFLSLVPVSGQRTPAGFFSC